MPTRTADSSARPLIVFTGQGISRADDFDLEGLLRGADELQPCFRSAGAGAATLDDVFTSCRPHRHLLDPLLVQTYRFCRAWWAGGLLLANHRGMFAAIGEVARTRPIVHLTTNLDGGSTRIAHQLGARWRPLTETAYVREIMRDLRDVLTSGRGIWHAPLHGEAGLFAVRGEEHDGARLLFTSDVDRPDGWWTLAEGVGSAEVPVIETQMALSQWGYAFLRRLLTGEEFRVDEVDVAFASRLPAELLVVGYGAWTVAARDAYPFEKAVDGTEPAAPRNALLYKPRDRTPSRCVDNFENRGFTVHGYDRDLGAVVRSILLGRIEQRQSQIGGFSSDRCCWQRLP